MTTGNNMSFPGEFAIHLDIKYYVAYDIFLPVEYLTIPHIFHHMSSFLKLNPHISHFLLNGKFPKVSPHSLINTQGLFDRLENSESKLFGLSNISP